MSTSIREGSANISWLEATKAASSLRGAPEWADRFSRLDDLEKLHRRSLISANGVSTKRGARIREQAAAMRAEFLAISQAMIAVYRKLETAR
jgi:hypothetical protein